MKLESNTQLISLKEQREKKKYRQLTSRGSSLIHFFFIWHQRQHIRPSPTNSTDYFLEMTCGSHIAQPSLAIVVIFFFLLYLSHSLVPRLYSATLHSYNDHLLLYLDLDVCCVTLSHSLILLLFVLTYLLLLPLLCFFFILPLRSRSLMQHQTVVVVFSRQVRNKRSRRYACPFLICIEL